MKIWVLLLALMLIAVLGIVAEAVMVIHANGPQPCTINREKPQ